ncbi:3-isopropylmalate isomerase subunit [uncultured Alphaproteobacteria bacterium]|uniref:3-isopropylmalate dehydratase small subunit n=1 Tax=uncultured Alphaproteobacteria bacterium TaxID=91750 RepID=A0A212K5D2_9PROT|nr:3-isopropylmalate isomerase subunit [uncultured Alphaproteobacteria bacterium]
MKAFERVRGLVAPLDRRDVDTDAIIPKQFMKSIKRTGFGKNLFDSWRYLDDGEPDADCSERPRNPDFPLNRPRYAGASILLCRENFGCGSSREHAVWAIEDYGFRALVGVSFADIFRNNCIKNGILPLTLSGATIDHLFGLVRTVEGFSLDIDLPEQTVRAPATGEVWRFEIDAFRKHCLLTGLDDVELTLLEVDRIRDHEARRRRETPWLVRRAG